MKQNEAKRKNLNSKAYKEEKRLGFVFTLNNTFLNRRNRPLKEW